MYSQHSGLERARSMKACRGDYNTAVGWRRAEDVRLGGILNRTLSASMPKPVRLASLRVLNAAGPAFRLVSAAAPTLIGMRVLVVDDETRLTELLTKGLTAEGFAVDVAHDGRDGLWLAERIRQSYPETAVIMATGVQDVGPAVQGIGPDRESGRHGGLGERPRQVATGP